MKIEFYEREYWLEHFELHAHAAVFEPGVSRNEGGFHFALMVVDEETDTPIIYVTCLKTTAGGVFIEYGGSFPDFRGSMKVLRAFRAVNEWFKINLFKYAMLATRNTNAAMNKLALADDYFVTGVHTDDGRLYLDYTKELL